MGRKGHWTDWLIAGVLCLTSAVGVAQQQPAPPQQEQKQEQQQDIPDAPSAVRPPQPLPVPPPTANPASQAPNQAPTSQQTTPSTKPAQPQGSVPPTPAEPKTVPRGGATPGQSNSREELYTLTTSVNFVVVPVTVKDRSNGRMVDGLLPKDFAVYENGVKQKLTYFTSDPFFLSAAIIIDLGLPDVAVQKINQSYPALLGAFSPYDQVAVYTYSSTVSRLIDFTMPNTQKLTAVLNELKTERGRNSGVPVLGGPLASGPTVNGLPVQTGVQPVKTPPKESRVLNDAILRAAIDLSHQDRMRRKVIFVISDGREQSSTASYADTLKVLLTNQITVYGVAVDSSALPGYRQLSKLHLPRFGYDNLLPKYAAATGGEVFIEFSQNAIETAYAHAMGQARNQYTLGYQTKAVPSGNYREIEVKVAIPDLDLHARQGYYPLPPQREVQ